MLNLEKHRTFLQTTDRNFKLFLNDLATSRQSFAKKAQEDLQEKLNQHEMQINKLDELCVQQAVKVNNQKQELRKFKKIREGYNMLMNQLDKHRSELSSIVNKKRALSQEVTNRCNQQQDILRKQQQSLVQTQAEKNNSSQVAQKNGVSIEIRSKDSLIIQIKQKSYELNYHRDSCKWSTMHNDSRVVRAITEFNVHDNARQLVSTLRYIDRNE